MNKYHNKPTYVGGQRFDSVKEANRWCELRLLERAGVITRLQRQVTFTIIPPQYDEDGTLLEKKATYRADFVYEQGGKTVVEDTKGVKTAEYILKRKLMLRELGIRIKET